MKKRITTFLITLLIVTCSIGLSACDLFGGGEKNNSSDSSGSGTENDIQPETSMEVTGEIPFNLENDFYFYVEMKPVPDALNPTFASFTAIRKNDDSSDYYSVYANYTFCKYKNYADYHSDTIKEKYVEERTLYEGIDFRKSSAVKANSSGSLVNVYYPEEWNTKVPENTTMSTTIQYIENFLNGNHTADTPYQNETAQTAKIPSDLSTMIHAKNVGIPELTANFEVYNDGTENMTFARFEKSATATAPATLYNEQAYSADITKYRGVWNYQDNAGVWHNADYSNVKVWGNIVVSATPVEGKTLMKRIISAKFSTEVTQETFEAVMEEVGFVDPIIS